MKLFAIASLFALTALLPAGAARAASHEDGFRSSSSQAQEYQRREDRRQDRREDRRQDRRNDG
jgi:hypothetical protein